VLHATGTRSIDRLGGLAKDMPVTAGCTLVGCLAVAALPPFNGFIGEWLLYRALFGAIHEQPWLAALAIPALAFTGALAAAAFVKTFGMIFLGEPRDPTIPAAHDPPPTMRGAMMATAVACAVLGIATVAVLPVLDQVVAAWSSAGGAPPLGTLVGHDLLIMGMACAALTGVMAVAWRFLGRRLPATAVRRTGTWDCGYAAPTARMQYTGRSLTAWLGDMIPGLRALVVVPRVRSLFPVRERFSATTPDALGDRIYAPRLQRAAERIMRLRWLQQGLLHMYLLYVLIGLVILFTWMLIRTGIAG
jgi:hydrogenase-4 component B